MDDSTPATKADLKTALQNLKEELITHFKHYATKADLQDLEQVLRRDFATKSDLEKAVHYLEHSQESGFKRIHEDINQVLDVLIAVDKRLGGKVENHEKRIKRLEHAMV